MFDGSGGKIIPKRDVTRSVFFLATVGMFIIARENQYGALTVIWTGSAEIEYAVIRVQYINSKVIEKKQYFLDGKAFGRIRVSETNTLVKVSSQ